MQIILNHVTRMGTSRICVAGVDPASLSHIRPVTDHNHQLTRALLREHGGPFRPGALVDVGTATPSPTPPQTEDYRIARAHARRIRDLDHGEYWDILSSISVPSFAEAFGPSIVSPFPNKLAVPPDSGWRSLAVMQFNQVELHVQQDRLYLHAEDVNGVAARLRVTDVRFYEPDHQTLRMNVVEDTRRRLADGEPLRTMVGLTRASARGEDEQKLHWVQVNGLCLLQSPVPDVP